MTSDDDISVLSTVSCVGSCAASSPGGLVLVALGNNDNDMSTFDIINIKGCSISYVAI